MDSLIAFYQNRAEKCRDDINRLNKKIHTAGTLRLLILLAAIASLWLLWEKDWTTLGIVTLIYAIPFMALMVYHDKLSKTRANRETLAQLCLNELKGIVEYDFSSFDGAKERIDGEHTFSLDLDVFGNRSVFQSVNRTVTLMGKELLADWFERPLNDKDEILKRQEAIRELSQLTDLRQDFYVEGAQHKDKNRSADCQDLSKLTAIAPAFANRIFWRMAIYIAPLVWIIIFGGMIGGYISFAVFNIMFLVSVFVAYVRLKNINRLHNTVNRMEKILKVYSVLMKTLENAAFASAALREIRGRLSGNGLAASQAIRQLSGNIGALDQRATLTGALMNIFTLRDIRTSIAIERWNAKHGAAIGQWFGALASFDALSSMAGFAFNHPDYAFPQISDSYFKIEGRNMGHPLIRRECCVTNGINIESAPSFIIITGANMAGKSTYLRTVGVNFMLACAGMPVCAEYLSLYPAKLFTSLRTSDSLAGNESYFFAELKRLKAIIDSLKEGDRLFVVLDEILKGTNSTDKQKGSFALVEQLISLQTCGIIATHDLALASLEQGFPGKIKNFSFEADIVDNKLSFTYRLREGVAVNMNATFLMKQMGITL